MPTATTWCPARRRRWTASPDTLSGLVEAPKTRVFLFCIGFCNYNILPQKAAECYIGLCKKSFAACGAEIFFGAKRRIIIWGCVKSLFMALRAKFKFETDVFFMILRSKIMKNTSVSK
jgi:hypothetical protein